MFVDFDTLLRESDFICVTCALNDQTREIFDEEAFSKMKSSAIIINISRGSEEVQYRKGEVEDG